MSKSNNFWVVFVLALATVIVGSTIIANNTQTPKEVTVGGNFNPVKVDFAQGISVNGVDFVSNTRGVTATTLTATGASTIGGTTAGLYSYSPVTTLTSDTTLTAAQTGTVFNMGTAGVDVTLPAPTAANGVRYRFVVSAAFATTDMTITVGNTDLIEGSLIVAGAVVACDAADTITIAAANEDIGDFIELYSNGTKWMIGANQAMTASNHACSG